MSELRLVALYANQVARAIVWMDDRLSIFFNAMRSTHNTFAIDRSITINVLGTPALHLHLWGGTGPFTTEILTHICSCHNFFPLSSVQILLIPACCLLCVLQDDMGNVSIGTFS